MKNIGKAMGYTLLGILSITTLFAIIGLSLYLLLEKTKYVILAVVITGLIKFFHAAGKEFWEKILEK